ncbi:hypothetical protein B0H67DRAFT_639991 [Lasiosphaeris hirsuta]|uniref:Zn(2)-C6 fungal-type domain-containing protein n=1 Tax=Lasiosphaeris hirsuta TaxID=260670 RepID=A0AA40BCA0_9PEZI|nr:hypothetical protein B0H67DRAFT_639991 [Lasiosphaeris hirsuta]
MSRRDPLVTGSTTFYERTGSSTPNAFPLNLPGHDSRSRENPEHPGSPQDSSDPSEIYFDWPLYEAVTTEETTMSDVFSETGSAKSPSSALTTPSSAGNNHEADKDTPMPDYAPQDLHPIQVWPGIPDTPLPRSQTISIAPTIAPAENTSSSRPSRARCLPDSDKTSEVRKNGACLHCRIRRVACTADGVCSKCKEECGKLQGPLATTSAAEAHAQKMCLRRSPSEIIGGSAIRWCWDSYPTTGRDQFTGEHGSIFVFLSEVAIGPPLELKVCRFTSGGHEAWGIEPEASPSEDDILLWAKSQMGAERNESFESCIENLLLAFVQNDGLQKALNLEARKPDDASAKFAKDQQTWMKKLLDMRSMWKVWRCKQFYIRVASHGMVATSSPVLQPIQDHLRRRAEHAISSLEKSVLEGIDRFLAPFGIKGEHRYLQSALNISIWVSMWQLILIYRQSLSQMLIDQPGYPAPVFIDGASENLKRNQFRTATTQLFHSVVVVYSELFRTRKILDSLKDPRPGGLRNDAALQGAFKLAWEAHKDFYHGFQQASFQQMSTGDELIKAHIVAKEEKILARKRK